MNIFITGATGNLGKLVVQELKKITSENNIIALARNAEKAKDLGVSVRFADYNDKDSFLQALQGGGTLLLISASEVGKRMEQHKNVIEAAKQAGIQRIVYTSGLKADNTDVDIVAEHFLTEQALKTSGIAYTILRNGWYIENYAVQISLATHSGTLYGSAGNGRISLTARKDLAEAITKVLLDENHNGKTYDLANDTAYTLSDFAKIIGEVVGKEIKYQDLSEEDYANILTQAGFPEYVSKMFAMFDVMMQKEVFFSENPHLSNLLGRKTTPLAESIQEILKG